MSLPFDHVALTTLMSSWITCFKFFAMIKFSKFCKKQMLSRQLRCLQTFCICTRNKLIKAQAISPLTFFSLNSFMNTKTEFKSSHRSDSIKSTVPKTFGIFTGKHLYWSLFLIKLQAYRTYRLHAHLRFYFPLGKTLKNFINFLKNHVLKNA